MANIDDRRQQDRDHEFIDVVGDADRNDLLVGEYSCESYVENNKAVDELRDECGACGAQPNILVPVNFLNCWNTKTSTS